MVSLERTPPGHQSYQLSDMKFMSLHRSDWANLGMVSWAVWNFSTQPRGTLALAFINKWQETESDNTWHGIIFKTTT